MVISLQFEELEAQIDFDILAVNFLNRIDASINSKNLSTARNIFENSQDLIIDKILDIDELRKAKTKEVIEFKRYKSNRRHKKVC